MESGARYCERSPHPDVENNFPRKPISYYIDFPSNGTDSETGFLFVINGYGASPSDSYYRHIQGYFADRYNCIVVGVEYFDIENKRKSIASCRLRDGFFDVFNRVYGSNISKNNNIDDHALLVYLAKALVDAKHSQFDSELFLTYTPVDCYQSFGLISALDHLQVLSEVLSMCKINKERMYIMGTSFGGYIGLLLGKLAPQTFQLIVDNSGFTEPRLVDVYGKGFSKINILGCDIAVQHIGYWSDDPSSGKYFDVHHSEIRSLLVRDHIFKTKTQYFCAHYVDDKMAPFDGKVEFSSLRPDVDVTCDFVDASMIDGALYKIPEHGMDASLKLLFERAYSDFIAKDKTLSVETDFDLCSSYNFICSNGVSYLIDFSRDDLKFRINMPSA